MSSWTDKPRNPRLESRLILLREEPPTETFESLESLKRWRQSLGFNPIDLARVAALIDQVIEDRRGENGVYTGPSETCLICGWVSVHVHGRTCQIGQQQLAAASSDLKIAPGADSGLQSRPDALEVPDAGAALPGGSPRGHVPEGGPAS